MSSPVVNKSRRRARTTVVALAAALILTAGYQANRLLSTGDDWLIHRMVTLTPSRIKAERLAARLSSGDPARAKAAADAIAALSKPAEIKALVSYAGETWNTDGDAGSIREDEHSRKLFDAMGRFGPQAVIPLIEFCKGDGRRQEPFWARWLPALSERVYGRHGRIAWAALTVVHRMGRTATKPLTALLFGSDLENRRLAASVLSSGIADEEEIAALVAYVRWAQGGEKVEAVRCLRQQNSPLVADALVEVLKTSSSDDIICPSACSLAGRGDARAVPFLRASLKSRNRYYRRAALAGLLRFSGDDIQSALIEALKDSDADVRRSAAQGLLRIGDARAIEALRAIKDSDGDSTARLFASRAIDGIAQRQGREGGGAPAREDVESTDARIESTRPR